MQGQHLHVYSRLQWLTESSVVPLLYGEGSRAFTRLQEEIIKSSHDHSLFCWTRTRNTPRQWESILAPSPEEFENSGDYVPKEYKEELTPYAMTNLGLSIRLPVIHTLTYPLVLLNAGLRNHRKGHRACLSMIYPSAHSVPDPMLSRHSFPEGPINLEPFKARLMRRHHFYIFAGPPVPFSWTDANEHLVKSPHHVLIVMQPTNSRLFQGSQPLAFQNPGNSGHEVSFIDCPSIETYPLQMFDFTRSILHLPTIEGGSGQISAGVIFLSYAGEQERGYFLFFGCRTYANHKREWGCKITSHASLGRRSQDQNEMKHLLKVFVKAGFSDRTARCSHVPDGSLILKLTTSMPFGEDQSLQIATLRGPEQESMWADDDDDEEASDADSTCAVAEG